MFFSLILYLSHVLKEYIGRDLVVRIRSEAVLEIVEVEAEADESPHCLSRNAAEHSQLLQLTSRSKYALKYVNTTLASDQTKI